jgi:general secretion pathway protein J
MTLSMHSKQSFRTNTGFTLVEVMVALAIMAIVAAIAFSGLRIGLDSWDRGSRAIDTFDRRLTIERLLKRQLALANPLSFQATDPKAAFFRGTNNRLEFISDYSLANGAGEFRKIDYAVEGGRFSYGEKSLFDYAPAETEEPPTDLLATFKSVSFRFLGQDQNGDAAWLDEWQLGRRGLPVAVLAQIDGDNFIVQLVNR